MFQMYGTKEVTSVDECRFVAFMKINKPKGKMPLAKVKEIDGSLMPPSKTVIFQQIKRANAISLNCALK